MTETKQIKINQQLESIEISNQNKQEKKWIIICKDFWNYPCNDCIDKKYQSTLDLITDKGIECKKIYLEHICNYELTGKWSRSWRSFTDEQGRAAFCIKCHIWGKIESFYCWEEHGADCLTCDNCAEKRS